MPYDPAQPADFSPLDPQVMRDQLNSLHELIVNVPAGPPGPGLDFRGEWETGVAYAPGDVVFYGERLFVAIGASQDTTPDGDVAHWRTLSITGPPGEVTLADLQAERVNNAVNPTGVTVLGLSVSDPPAQSEVQALASKLDALITALRREP